MLANAIGAGDKADASARREALEALVLLSAPMMPHLAEELLAGAGPQQACGRNGLAEIRSGPDRIRPRHVSLSRSMASSAVTLDGTRTPTARRSKPRALALKTV